MNDVRKIEIFKNEQWTESDFLDIKTGDRFRLYEPTGEIVKGNNGESEFIAKNNPYIMDGVYGVDVEGGEGD